MEEVFHSPLHFMAGEIDFLSPPEELGMHPEPMDTSNCRMVSDIPSGEQRLLAFKNIWTTVNASIWTGTRAIGLHHRQSPAMAASCLPDPGKLELCGPRFIWIHNSSTGLHILRHQDFELGLSCQVGT